ncbi:MAG: hypothetical protein GC150_07320 [Rhizobiales bacterium]|nr:hypothetical protein [Hyphomicrobiales bacterium]
MRFKIPGEFETETLLDLSQRIMAVLQDAGVERVAQLNVYLSIVGRDGLQRELERDGEPIDTLTLDGRDLACPSRPDRLTVSDRPAESRPAARSEARRAPAAKRQGERR